MKKRLGCNVGALARFYYTSMITGKIMGLRLVFL